MPESAHTPENMAHAASVRNQVQKPAGILPKNAQAWAMAGLSVVMVAAIAISGNPGSTTKSTTAPARPAPVVDPNGARIREYRNRLEAETQRLAAEQARLDQAKHAMGVEQHSTPGNGAPTPPAPHGTADFSQQTSADARVDTQRQLEAEKARKEFLSLFASNVALSYRKDLTDKAPDVSSASSKSPAALPPPLYPYFYAVPPTAPPPGAGTAQGPPPTTPISAPAPPRAPLATDPITRDPEGAPESQSSPPPNRHEKADPELTKANGKQYRLLEGTILETILTNRLAGSFFGPVNCMLAADVYSHDRQHLLIPQGSRILGEVKPVNSLGQQRLAVVFHRIVMPDGYSASLDQFQGLSQIGETGLRDQVNHHYLEIFGVSIAIGSIAGLAQANTQYGLSLSAADTYRQGFAASLSESSLRILERFLNILPTFAIREGNRIKIYLASDLLLPAYIRHTIGNDF
jgi:type IV secretion system protein TrbI